MSRAQLSRSECKSANGTVRLVLRSPYKVYLHSRSQLSKSETVSEYCNHPSVCLSMHLQLAQRLNYAFLVSPIHCSVQFPYSLLLPFPLLPSITSSPLPFPPSPFLLNLNLSQHVLHRSFLQERRKRRSKIRNAFFETILKFLKYMEYVSFFSS